MAPQTRRGPSFPKIVIERDSDTEDSSEEEDFDDEVQKLAGEASDDEQAEEKDDASTSTKRKREPITISLKRVCKVCKQSGHEAGFRGATYIDCPMKPCFLCKLPGHTTMTCPHKVATEFGVSPAPLKNSHNSLKYLFDRQLRCHVPKMKPAFVIPNKVNCAVIRYHSRRVTCLEFHPTKNNILISGDKKGQLGVWDYEKVHERIVYGNIHSCILNNMKYNPLNDGTVYGASSDGTVSCTDLETGISSSLVNLNPTGWQGPSSWKMLYGLDLNSDKGILLAADNFGLLYMIDARSNNVTGKPILIHKKKSKVTGLHCHPLQPDLLLSCGNDHFDNRIRVWDSIFGDLDSPSREIVHSQDFNRHLTPFRAEWDPKDISESLVVVGRYISENYNGVALHPIDFIDITNGQLVAEVMDPNIMTITPVNKLHPRDDVLASGSSRSIFIWKPQENTELEREEVANRIIICGKAEKSRKGKLDDDSGDDDMFDSKKNSKTKKIHVKSKVHGGKRKC
ncbi:protein DAMAGED DNA-BINDING 2-like isoform X2 [Salvia splendens]|uniref:protein DAMAGED DNA-BINDING 2-like isoform X2 n=1 Tax=Salvia splendens TaxID=180675 RepID=UPI001C2523D8|nr:protein DAMAGED DNA-BINDING 2-like isoform X2 [Salvia splendens]